MYLASCNCGKVTASTSVEPVRVSVCHCRACQRRTGSAFGVQARFNQSDVSITGSLKQYVRTSDEGNSVVFNFCPDCGATLYFKLEGLPKVIVIPAGNFANDEAQVEIPWQPSVSIYEARSCDWLTLKNIEERYD